MSKKTMKAVRFHGFGGPEVLVHEDAPRPEANPGEVLVRVYAAGVNPPDSYLPGGSNGVQLAELGRLLDDGTIRAVLDSTYRLADARVAHERAAQGYTQGKIVLDAE